MLWVQDSSCYRNSARFRFFQARDENYFDTGSLKASDSTLVALQLLRLGDLIKDRNGLDGQVIKCTDLLNDISVSHVDLPVLKVVLDRVVKCNVPDRRDR